MLDQVFDCLSRNDYDALIIAGDVYDRAVPPPEAVSLFSNFLQRLADADIQAVIIAGNHDSTARLGFAHGMLNRVGIHLRCDYARLAEPVRLVDQKGLEVDVFALPFVETLPLREALDLDAECARTTTETVAAALDIMREVRREGVPTVLISHEFVGGTLTSESERVFIGGAHVLDASLYQGFDYVALGHLHRPQTAGGDTVRYSGSLLAYSFSEAGDTKGGVSLTFSTEQTEPVISNVDFTPRHPLSVVKGAFDALCSDSRYERYRDHYVSAQLTDDGFHLNLHARLRQHFPRLLEVRQLKIEEQSLARVEVTADAPETPAALFEEFLDLFAWEEDDRLWATSTFQSAVEAARTSERGQ